MVKVELLKLDEEYMQNASDEEKDRVGKMFEAFEITDDYAKEEKYKKQYALNLHNCIWFVPVSWCRVVEEPTLESGVQAQSVSNRTTKKFLLVEDGSVDVDFIENELDIHCIVYRQGANKPEWLEF